MLRMLEWALRHTAASDYIARHGRATALTAAQVVDRLLDTVQMQFPSLKRPMRVHMVTSSRETRSYLTLADSLRESARVTTVANASESADVVVLPVTNLYIGECNKKASCFNTTLNAQLARHAGRVIVAVDLSDLPTMLPATALNDETRVHLLFKRSRVDRPVGRFVEYPRPVWPIYYPVKPAWLAAIEKEGSAAPRSKRTYDVAVFLPEPPPGAC